MCDAIFDIIWEIFPCAFVEDFCSAISPINFGNRVGEILDKLVVLTEVEDNLRFAFGIELSVMLVRVCSESGLRWIAATMRDNDEKGSINSDLLHKNTSNKKELRKIPYGEIIT